VRGAVAQLGEHLLCKQGVAGSIPVRSIKMYTPQQTDASSPSREVPQRPFDLPGWPLLHPVRPALVY
jgi:hypothetical protein